METIISSTIEALADPMLVKRNGPIDDLSLSQAFISKCTEGTDTLGAILHKLSKN